jgi:hypothetical protein
MNLNFALNLDINSKKYMVSIREILHFHYVIGVDYK